MAKHIHVHFNDAPSKGMSLLKEAQRPLSKMETDLYNAYKELKKEGNDKQAEGARISLNMFDKLKDQIEHTINSQGEHL
jgi:DnaJ-domain-containing protein 1